MTTSHMTTTQLRSTGISVLLPRPDLHQRSRAVRPEITQRRGHVVYLLPAHGSIHVVHEAVLAALAVAEVDVSAVVRGGWVERIRERG